MVVFQSTLFRSSNVCDSTNVYTPPPLLVSKYDDTSFNFKLYWWWGRRRKAINEVDPSPTERFLLSPGEKKK